MLGVSSLKFGAAFFVFFTIVLSVFATGCLALDERDLAISAVDRAEQAVVEAFMAILEAEEAGADLKDLLNQMNIAVDYLASADMCLRCGDFDGAVGNASFCVEALDGIVDDAEILRDGANREFGKRSWRAICGSILGVALVICASFLGWSLFKRRYFERLLEMKPEVVQGES